MIPNSHPLATVGGAFNAVFVRSKAAGELMFYGPGAGGAPTASAVLGDLVTVARHRVSGSLGPGESNYAARPVVPISEAVTRYHVSLDVHDQPGVLAAVAGAFRTAWDHLVVEDRPAAADAIVCFGSRHWRVPERAASLWRDGVAPLIVVTGGPATEGEPPEADRFAAVLRREGVAPDAIVVEREARHTGENVELGLAALDRRAAVGRVALVSWPLAARRCRATIEAARPGVHAACAPALPGPGVRWAPSWRRIRLALGEVDRLGRYAAAGLIAPQVEPAAVTAAAAVLRGAVADASAHHAPSVVVEAAGARREPQ